MGRPRGFDEAIVIASAAELFLSRGYEATSIDDLVTATGVHRGSLYKAFGSKRGLFLAALQRWLDQELPAAVAGTGDPIATDALDLLLVAALELAPRDPEIRDLVLRGCQRLSLDHRSAEPVDPACLLGRRLLHRAGATLTQPALAEEKH
jgi:TetR/AcrR family transcriptional regulator, transcriptional repressor for nem operon